MSERTVAVIQARMGSTRLPEKVLKNVAGRPMLWHVVNRTRVASLLDDVVVATSLKARDDPIADFCEEHGVECYRGSEEDVLDRYYQTALNCDADTVVRVTSDCPLISPETIDRVVRKFYESNDDFVTNTLHYTYPDGLDVEVFSSGLLERAWEEASTPDEREHVTPFMRDPDRFDLLNVTNPVDVSEYSFFDSDIVFRWTVDYPMDLEFVRAVYDHLYTNGEWTINQVAVLELLEREPELRNINDDRSHGE